MEVTYYESEKRECAEAFVMQTLCHAISNLYALCVQQYYSVTHGNLRSRLAIICQLNCTEACNQR